MLLEAGARLEVKDVWGATPLISALAARNRHAATYLLGELLLWLRFCTPGTTVCVLQATSSTAPHPPQSARSSASRALPLW
jgi:hypothetical protein